MKNIAFIFLYFFSGSATVKSNPQIDFVNKDFLYETYIEPIANKIDSTLTRFSFGKKVHNHQVTARKQILFLNRDFKTKAFNRYNIVKTADFFVDESSPNYVHFGIIEVGFNRCRDLDRAYHTVVKTNRKNFLLEVLTVFTVLRLDHSLLILYSETPYAPPVLQLNQEIEVFANEKRKCQP